MSHRGKKNPIVGAANELLVVESLEIDGYSYEKTAKRTGFLMSTIKKYAGPKHNRTSRYLEVAAMLLNRGKPIGLAGEVRSGALIPPQNTGPYHEDLEYTATDYKTERMIDARKIRRAAAGLALSLMDKAESLQRGPSPYWPDIERIATLAGGFAKLNLDYSKYLDDFDERWGEELGVSEVERDVEAIKTIILETLAENPQLRNKVIEELSQRHGGVKVVPR